ncbi:MAG: imidazole glycerol phosphate synthase subunit HisH [Bacillota bacterium]
MNYIAIIDYGVGNLFSLSSSLKYIGMDSIVTDKAEEIEKARSIILPGVGAFRGAMDRLYRTGLVPVINRQVSMGKPLMGICLGMQMLFDESHEYGIHKGLGYISGTVCSLEDDFADGKIELKVPHVGWSGLEISDAGHPLMKYTKEGDYFYFVHSFYAKNCRDNIVASVNYGVTIPAVVAKGNVFGCQFHPEKSGETGLRVLKAFSEI